jgi:dTDP-4-amino-4,6-dideoxygalactose transaminase
MRETLLPYFRPHIDERTIARVTDALRNGWLTTGPTTHAFEERIAALAGVRHAIAVNSATAGLHLAMVARDIGPGDEVVLPALSFVSAAHCVRHCGATPVFCDVEPDTLCVSVATIEPHLTARTKAIVTMPYAGRPLGNQTVYAYAAARGITVIEDAALGIGTLDDGHWPGAAGSDCAIFSFYATKNITSAEGGMLLTNDDALAERVRLLALHGMDRDAWKRYSAGGSWRYDVTAVGFKYNLPDLCATLALGQLELLETMQQRRDAIAARYLAALASIEGVVPAALGRIGPNDRHSWCFFPVSIAPHDDITRETVAIAMRAANISTSVHYIPSHLFSIYRDRAPSLPITEVAWTRLLSLPLFPAMTDDDADDVIDALAFALAGRRHAVAR